MKIKSRIDVITNSSNEVFIYKSNKDPKVILKEIKKILGPNPQCSGMGGVLEVARGGELEDFDYKETYEGIPKDYILINMDYGFIHTDGIKEYLLETFGEPLSDKDIEALLEPAYRRRFEASITNLQSHSGEEITEELINIFEEYCHNYWCLSDLSSDLPKLSDPDILLPFIKSYEEERDKYQKELSEIQDKEAQWEKVDDLEYYIKVYDIMIKHGKELYEENKK